MLNTSKYTELESPANPSTVVLILRFTMGRGKGLYWRTTEGHSGEKSMFTRGEMQARVYSQTATRRQHSPKGFHALTVILLTSAFLLTEAFVLPVPSLALDSSVESDVVPRCIINLDLCTLAYQLYHQSLCLPLDPWYDVFSRVGSDRRNNICRFTHEYASKLGNPLTMATVASSDSPHKGFYSGPNAARGWADSNLNLDPIITNYQQTDARQPAFTRDGEIFIALAAPGYLSKNIKTIEGMRYRSKPTGFPYNDVERFQIRQYTDGEDHLVAFEGGTGVAGNTEPAWSLMGFVLMRKTATGRDAYIVFRGSRSGSALSKTVWKAQDYIGTAKGNPDWITDLRSGKQIQQPLISKVGTVTQGFAESLPTMLGPITACCKYLEQKYSAPEHIYVTGHSLGAGLASQFVSAVVQGAYGDELRNEVKSWPWNNITLTAYAQPIPGDPAWAASFDKACPTAAHYWVEGDDVVEATSGRMVGLLIDKGEHCGAQNKLSKLASCNDNPHEVFVIRGALLRDMPKDALIASLGSESTWGYYDNFAKMLAGEPKSFVGTGAQGAKIVTSDNLRSMLQNYNFGGETEQWLEHVYARMIADKSSYIGPKFQSTLDERQKLVMDIVGRMRKPPAADAAQELDALANDFTALDGNLGLEDEEQWVYSAMILDRIQKAGLSVTDLQSNSTINACLESK